MEMKKEYSLRMIGQAQHINQLGEIKMKRQTELMTLRITEELKNKLSVIAQAEKLSISEVARKLCEEYVEWQQEKIELNKT